jgi:autotransporter-associated beta strand protein
LTNPWTLDEGTLEVVTSQALGAGMVTMNGGVLAARNVAVPNPIRVTGGALGTRSGDVTDFQGTILVEGPMGVNLLSYTTPTNSQTITLSGSLEGNGNITVTGLLPQTNGGNKALVLTNPINSYSGTIFVSPGQFLTSQPVSTGSALGTATVSLNDAGLNIRDNGLANDSFLPYNNAVIVTGAGASSIDVNRGATGAFVGNTARLGTLSIGAQTLNVTGGNTYKAAFSGTTTLTAAPTFQPTTADLSFEENITGAFGFTKAGAGRMVVAAATTFTGPVTVQAGTLAVNDPGSTAAESAFTVQGGSLIGTGVIGGDVNVTGGSLAPGDGIGVLSVGGNVAFSPGSVFSVQLSRTNLDPLVPVIAGIDYDQLNLSLSAASTVTLNNASLTLNVGTGILENDLFFVLLNDGADAINGVFAGLSDGAIFNSGGQFFQISYDADADAGQFNAVGGNDIALMAVPEPGSLLLLGGGLFLLSGRRRRA